MLVGLVENSHFCWFTEALITKKKEPKKKKKKHGAQSTGRALDLVFRASLSDDIAFQWVVHGVWCSSLLFHEMRKAW